MPIRTINDALFAFKNDKGVIIHARRGDQVDIPEGDDLVRGEKCDSFTKDNAEPKPPEGTEMPAIDPVWELDDFKRYVDEGTVEEIKAKFLVVPEEVQATTAQRLLAAEESRGEKVRKSLVDFLNGYTETQANAEPVAEPAPEVPVETPAEEVQAETPDDGPKLFTPKK